MITLDIVLVVVAALLTVFAIRFEQYRFKNGRSIGVGMLAGGLAAAFVAYVIFRHILAIGFNAAHGHFGWAHNGLVRWALIVAVAAVIGLWVWLLDRRRYHKDDC